MLTCTAKTQQLCSPHCFKTSDTLGDGEKTKLQGLTLQTPGGAGVGGARRSALVWDHVDVQDEDVRSVLPAVHHRVQISSFLQTVRKRRIETKERIEGRNQRKTRTMKMRAEKKEVLRTEEEMTGLGRRVKEASSQIFVRVSIIIITRLELTNS